MQLESVPMGLCNLGGAEFTESALSLVVGTVSVLLFEDLPFLFSFFLWDLQVFFNILVFDFFSRGWQMLVSMCQYLSVYYTLCNAIIGRFVFETGQWAYHYHQCYATYKLYPIAQSSDFTTIQ